MVEASKNPDYLRKMQKAVDDFKRAFAAFLELHGTNKGATGIARAMMPAAWPLEEADAEEVARRRSAVSIAAGRASEVPALTGTFIRVAAPGGPPQVVDPIASWATMLDPKPLLEPGNVLEACDQMIGKLDGLIAKAEAEAPPSVGTEALHPLVWGAARRLWRDGHYREAVNAAAEAVIGHVKALTRRNDVPETSLWQQVFSKDEPTAGKPRLRWPGDPADRNVINMNDGLRFFAPGVQLLIRNTGTHSVLEIGEQEAIERLAVLSLLARWVEGCDLLEMANSDS